MQFCDGCRYSINTSERILHTKVAGNKQYNWTDFDFFSDIFHEGVDLVDLWLPLIEEAQTNPIRFVWACEHETEPESRVSYARSVRVVNTDVMSILNVACISIRTSFSIKLALEGFQIFAPDIETTKNAWLQLDFKLSQCDRIPPERHQFEWPAYLYSYISFLHMSYHMLCDFMYLRIRLFLMSAVRQALKMSNTTLRVNIDSDLVCLSCQCIKLQVDPLPS